MKTPLRTLAILVGTMAAAPVTTIAGTDLSSVLIRGVPHVRQKPDFCGEACVAMALKKLGHQADQDFVYDQSGLDPVKGRGCYTRELATAVKKIGFDPGLVWHKTKPGQANARMKSLFETIHRDLKAGHPAIVCMHYDDSPQTTEHFRLIVGYDAERDEVIFHEPARDQGAHQRMARSRFLKLWPLRYRSDEWTIVLLRMRPAKSIRATVSERSDADYAQHIMRLRKRLPDKTFHIVLQKPFVVIGDESPEMVKRRAVGTVKWAVDRIKKDYFSRDPNNIIDVWLFRDKKSYNTNAEKLWKSKPGTPFGYYSSTHNALVMNISTGGGTLVHEIVHPFMESNFPKCPSWFNEGLASLYEQSRDKRGHIWGSTNWRLRGLQKAIAEERVPPFRTLCSTSRFEFYERDPGTNYSQARYLCYYLQERGLLVKYYHDFRRNVKTDPTGYATLRKTLDVNDMAKFQEKWEAWVTTLRF